MAHVTIEDRLHVDATPREVWQAIEDPAEHATWHPFVTGIAGEHRAGAERRCSVLVGRRDGETRERCIEVEPERAITWTIEDDTTGFSRMVADWRAGFALVADGRGTTVTAHSAFRPRNVIVRALLPLIRRKFHQTQRDILSALASHLGHTRTV